jgi:hypothetical protein
MPPSKRSTKKHAKARQRRRLKAHERLARDRRQAQHAAEALQQALGQVHSEDAYYGHLVLRLIGCLVLFYTSRVVCKGRLTMEEIIFSLKHYWRFVDSETLELKTLSREVDEKAP